MNRKLINNLIALSVLWVSTLFFSCALSAPGATTKELVAAVCVALFGASLMYPFVKRLALHF